jgi:hypothetical protein
MHKIIYIAGKPLAANNIAVIKKSDVKNNICLAISGINQLQLLNL